jgi:hypothetical protein
MRPVRARWLLPGISAGLLALTACGNGAGAPAQPPSAQEILNKPEQASVRDAHFTLTAHISSGNVSFDASGDGLIVVKPEQASHFVMLAAIAGQSLKFEEIIIGGKEYDLTPDNPRWTVKDNVTSNPASFKGKNAVYLGEETLKGGKTWHVKAVDERGNPFEAWIRERDGYPLKYSSTSQGTSFTALFDRFNTGQSVSAPPASDIQS